MILKSAQVIYNFASQLKNKMYDVGILKTIKLSVPIISVGNLSVGGTGKTPCVYLIAGEFLKDHNFSRIVIVSRSYRGSLRKPQRVDLSWQDAPSYFGDEPCLLQKKLPNCSVWSGPSKYRTALAAIKAEKPDLIIVDDGFSHRKLGRHFDLVLIDATDPLDYFHTLPVGRLREPMTELKRSSAILVTKTNLADSGKLEFVTAMIEKVQPICFTAEAKMKATNLDPARDRLFVFCGLGNPDSLTSALEKLGFTISHLRKFADHHPYTATELNSILADFKLAQKQSPYLKLVTTAKDIIKIKEHPILYLINEVDYAIEMEPAKRTEFFEKIRSHL